VEIPIARALFRSRDPFRAIAVSLASTIALAIFYRGDFMRLADRVAAAIRTHAIPIALTTALALGAAATRYGTFIAGGSDSYGYVSQAYGWVNGDLPAPLPLPMTLSWPSGDETQIPLGYRLGPAPHTMVPTYAPGLSLLMAASIEVVGRCGPFIVTPVCAVFLVWFTFLLGRLVAGPIGGVVSAIVIATTPVVLFQAMAPMSDVAAGAFWTGALAAALGPSKKRALAAGICTAIGLSIRPNMLPLVAVPMLAAALAAERRGRAVRAALVLLPAVPVIVFSWTLNISWYGSPLATGYGHASEIYSAARVWPNLRLFVSWFLQSESPWALVGLVPLLAWRRTGLRGQAIVAAVLAVALTCACYLAYLPFGVWWYLRFLLPAGGAGAALVAAGIVALARVLPPPWGRLSAWITFVSLLTTTVPFAQRAGVFGDLRDGERRYADVGAFVARTLPSNAIVFALQHSGSLRFYAGRMTLRFDRIDTGWGPRAVAETIRLDRHPFLVVDDGEMLQARTTLGITPGTPFPYACVGRTPHAGVSVFDLAQTASASEPATIESGVTPCCSAPATPLTWR
jgi:hypothetical protein